MVLLANRVSADLPPPSSTSTSSAVVYLRTLSKICCALSCVSIQLSLVAFVRTPDLHVAETCRRGAVSRAHGLHRLSFAAVGRAPERPLIARADRVHRVPELGRDAGV